MSQSMLEASFHYVLREANSVADTLVKEGVFLSSKIFLCLTIFLYFSYCFCPVSAFVFWEQ